MESYYCPSCGKKQTAFTVSLGGLFIGQEENVNNFYTELSFLQKDDVILNYDKVKKCEQLRNLFDDEYISDNLPTETDIQAFSNMVDFDLNAEDMKLREENERKYLWIHNLVTLIREAVEEDNPFVQQMLSVEDPQEDQDWHIINLKDCFTKEKIQNLFNKLTYIVNRDMLSNAGEKVRDILKILDTADRCVMNCKKDLIMCGYEMDSEQKRHLISVTYGNVIAYKRICPECAASISPYFGLYPQKIISFIGTPSSGKSTIIVAAYHKLVSGRESLKGITAEFDSRSPYYQFYQDNNNKIKDKLSVKKTAKGEFPSLSVLLGSEKGKKCVYTFVDVPGEYFVSPDDKRFDMYKLEIIGQSDIIYTVFAGEQFIGSDRMSEEKAVLAEATDSVLNQYGLRCQALKNNFFRNKEMNIEILISKFDAIIPGEMDYVKKSDKKIWNKSNNAEEKYQMTAGDIDRFVKALKEPDEAYYDPTKKCLLSSKIREINDLAHRMYFGNADMTSGILRSVIKNLYSFGQDPDPQTIPVNFVSSFGFYALENIWRLSDEEKIAALAHSNNEKLKNISDEKRKEIIDSLKGAGGNNAQILKEYSISSEMLAKWFLEYYLHIHAGDNPCGINAFLYNMLESTEFLKDDSSYNREVMFDVIAEKIKVTDDEINKNLQEIGSKKKSLSEIKGLFKNKEKEERNREIEDLKKAVTNLQAQKQNYIKLQDNVSDIGNINLSTDEVENIYREFNKAFPESAIKYEV